MATWISLKKIRFILIGKSRNNDESLYLLLATQVFKSVCRLYLDQDPRDLQGLCTCISIWTSVTLKTYEFAKHARCVHDFMQSVGILHLANLLHYLRNHNFLQKELDFFNI